MYVRAAPRDDTFFCWVNALTCSFVLRINKVLKCLVKTQKRMALIDNGYCLQAFSPYSERRSGNNGQCMFAVVCDPVNVSDRGDETEAAVDIPRASPLRRRGLQRRNARAVSVDHFTL